MINNFAANDLYNCIDSLDSSCFEKFWLFWFLCGNEVYTDSFFDKIVLKVLPDKHFTIP